MCLVLSLFGDMFASCRKNLSKVNLHRDRATWNEGDLSLRWQWRCDSLPLKSVAGALFVVFCWCVACCCLRPLEGQISISWERMSGVVVVVVGAAFVVIVGFSRVCCVSDCCWFGCRGRDDRGVSHGRPSLRSFFGRPLKGQGTRKRSHGSANTCCIGAHPNLHCKQKRCQIHLRKGHIMAPLTL